MVKTCSNCGKEIGLIESYVKYKDGVILCLSCNKEEKRIKERELKKNIEDKSTTSIGKILSVFGILSSIICIIAGLWMLSISAGLDSIMLEYYNSFGLFVIGLGLFVGPLLYGLGKLVDKK